MESVALYSWLVLTQFSNAFQRGAGQYELYAKYLDQV